MKEKICLEDVLFDLEEIEERLQRIMSDLYDYGQSKEFQEAWKDIFAKEELKKLDELSWEAESAVFKLQMVFRNKKIKLEEKME